MINQDDLNKALALAGQQGAAAQSDQNQQAPIQSTPAPSQPGLLSEVGGAVKDAVTGNVSGAVSKAGDLATRGIKDVAQGMRDLPSSAYRGVADAVNNMTDMAKPTADWLAAHGLNPGYLEFGKGSDGSWLRWQRQTRPAAAQTMTPDSALGIADTPKSDSNTGKLIESIAQWETGFKMAGLAMKGVAGAAAATKLVNPETAATVLEGGGKLAEKARDAVKGGIAMFGAFDPHEQRLSNVVANNLSFARPFADFLAAKPGDGEATARLKNSLEGMLLNTSIETITGMLGATRISRLWKDAPEAEKPALESQFMDHINELINSDKKNRFQVEPTADGKWTITEAKTVYHGSPYDFDKFDISKVGTGEGSVAGGAPTGVYGHGLYFAESPEVAREYAKRLGTPENPGKMYTVQLSSNATDKMLNWEKPFDEQPESVKSALRKLGFDGNKYYVDGQSFFSKREADAVAKSTGKQITTSDPGVLIGKDFYEGLTNKMTGNAQSASEALRAKGVPGIQYLDQGSRIGGGDTSNYVLFHHDDIINTMKGEQPGGILLGSAYPRTFDNQSQAQAEAATYNMLYRKQLTATAPTVITDEQKSSLLALAKDMNSQDNPWLGQSPGIDFNLKNITSSDDVKAHLDAMSVIMRQGIDEARGGAQLSNAELRNKISQLFPSGDQDAILTSLGKLYTDSRDMGARLDAGYAFLAGKTATVAKLSTALDGDPGNAILMGQLSHEMDQMFTGGLWAKGVTTEVARTLQSLNGNNLQAVQERLAANAAKGAQKLASATEAVTNAIGTEGVVSEKIRAALPNMTTEQIMRLARQIKMSAGNPDGILNIAGLIHDTPTSQMAEPGFFSVLTQLAMGNMLSGPLTTLSNNIGNITNALGETMSRWGAGALKGDSQLRSEGTDLFTGYMYSIADAWKAAKTALETGKPALDVGNTAIDIQGPIRGMLGGVIDAPGRFLMAQDEFYKNLGYRSWIRAQALKEARNLGMDTKQTAEYVDKAIKDSVNDAGKALNQEGLAFARKATFQTPLKSGANADNWIERWGSIAANASAESPVFRFFAAPFTKTPTRIYETVWNYTPGTALLEKDIKSKIAEGDSDAYQLLAKQAMGGIVWSTAAGMFMSGRLTGQGPTDPNMRREWLKHNQPYSFNVGSADNPTWISYRRADPVMSPFGIVADIGTIAGEMNTHELDQAAYATIAGLTKVLSSKTYAYAISDFAEALTGDGSKIKNLLSSKAGSTFVPALVGQLNNDDELREIRGWVDNVMSRVPGFSKMLPPRTNIFGEPIMKAPNWANRAFNPFTVWSGKDGDSAMDKELLELGKGIAMPDKKALNTNIDMSSRQWGEKGNLTAYDRMIEIMNQPNAAMGGTMRDEIRREMQSPTWNMLSPGVNGVDQGGTRMDLINKIIQKRRLLAFDQTLKEFPELKKAWASASAQRTVAHKQGPVGFEANSQSLSNILQSSR